MYKDQQGKASVLLNILKGEQDRDTATEPFIKVRTQTEVRVVKAALKFRSPNPV